MLGVRLAGRLGVPGLLLYLVLGLLLGTFFPAMDLQDAELATVLGYTALVLILAQGGLTTRMSQLRPVMWPAITLASLGVAVSIAVVAVPLVLLLGVSTQNAILIGAVLAATDAAAVFSVMRRMRISSRVRTLLEAEAGFNDAPVVVLVSVVSSGAFDSTPYWQIPVIVLVELIGGAAVGIGVGYLARWVLPRLALPAVGLYPIAALALLVGAYGLADVLHVSGFLAVYVAAVLIGSTARLPHRRSIIGFADGLAWIAEIGLFVMLGALAEVSRLPPAIPLALVVCAILVFVARPLATVVSLVPFRLPWSTIAFTSVAGLRGAVPIVFAAIPLGLGVPGARLVFDVTLIVVLILMLVQMPMLKRVGPAARGGQVGRGRRARAGERAPRRHAGSGARHRGAQGLGPRRHVRQRDRPAGRGGGVAHRARGTAIAPGREHPDPCRRPGPIVTTRRRGRRRSERIRDVSTAAGWPAGSSSAERPGPGRLTSRRG